MYFAPRSYEYDFPGIIPHSEFVSTISQINKSGNPTNISKFCMESNPPSVATIDTLLTPASLT